MRQVEHRGIDGDGGDAHSEHVDGVLHGERELELSANGHRHASAGVEDGGRERPDVHAYARVAQGSERRRVRLLDDAAKHAVVTDVEQRKSRDALGGNVSVAEQTVAAEGGKCRCAGMSQHAQHIGRIVVVRVHDEERLAIGERFGGEHGVRGTDRLPLHGELDAQPRHRSLASVECANVVMLRPDNETYLGDARVGQCGEQVVEKGPPLGEGNHGLCPARGGLGLRAAERGRHFVARPHACAQSAREDDRFGDVGQQVCPRYCFTP